MFDFAKMPQLVKLTDNSDAYMQRNQLEFSNGLTLSVARGLATYGGRSGLFEIAVLNQNEHFITETVFPGTGDVIGYLSAEDVYQMAHDVALHSPLPDTNIRLH